MAGTLTVQNLQGPSSGANANKIIVPSGQTLDASAGMLVPSAGQVVQTVTNTSTASTNVTSSTWVALNETEISITPKMAGSKFIYTGSMGVEFDASTYSGSNALKPYYSINSGSYTAHTELMYAPNGDNSDAAQQCVTIVFPHSPTYTLGETVAYKLYFYQTTSGSSQFNQQFAGLPQSSFVTNTLQEIAQ
jgi:hypothetical protein